MKGGPLGTILPVLGGIAALGTGLGAAGIGPLAGLFSAGDAAGAAGAAGAGAADLGATAGFAGDAASIPLDVGATAFPSVADAGAAGFIPGSVSTALGAGDVGAAAPSIGSLGGGITPASTQVASAAPSSFSDVGGAGGGGNFLFPGTGSPFSQGTAGGSAADFLGGAATDLGAGAGTAATGAVDVGAATDAAFPVIGPAFSASTDAVSGIAPSAAPSASFGAGDVGGGGFLMPGTDTALAGGPAGDPASFSGFFSDSSGTSAATPWWQNPKNYLALAPLALMGGEALFGNAVPGSQPVTAAATTAATNEGILTGQGTQNMSYVNTGALPAGAQTAIDEAANAAKAQVRSSFASMGIPPGSTMEAENLAAVDQNAAAQKFTDQMNLLHAGIAQFNAGGAYGGLVNQADLALMQAQIQQEQELEQALAGFAGAFAASGTTFGAA